MAQQDWRNLIKVDNPTVGPVTKKTVECAKRLSHRFRGSMRMALGKIITDKEYEARRKKALNTPLP